MTQSIGPPSLAQGTRIAVGFSTSISRFIPACGELSKPSWAIVQLDGSSPLARGTQDLDRLGYVADRFIPAYAGNSYERKKVTEYTSVHPRLRGELLWSKIISNNAVRFIPAYAGNSISIRRKRKDSTVHPRLRGELSFSRVISKASRGSSPLTRGTLRIVGYLSVIRRFIPAYAGNSEAVSRKYSEKFGSSPLTRGTLA